MKLLFITDQLPYPPRNGVTIPLFHYLKGFSEHNEIYLIWTPNKNSKIDTTQIESNLRIVKNLWIVFRWKKPLFLRIFGELSFNEMGFNGWFYDEEQISIIFSQVIFDVIWISPITVIDVSEIVSKYYKNEPVMIAGINDCTTAFMRNNAKRAFLPSTPLKRRLLCSIGWVRSLFLGITESRILKKFHLIIAQTPIDVQWLDRISNGKLSKKCIALSNGVDPSLFDLPIERHSDILFIANLEAAYGDVAFFLLNQVWPTIKKSISESRFFIVGKGASDRLLHLISLDERVVYHPFIQNLAEVYEGKAVSVAPSFKNYGLINKVVEAMAAGVPVVGDCGSFNGIKGFENGQHGIVANNFNKMAISVISILQSHEYARKIAADARELVRKQFDWNDRIDIISRKIEDKLI